MSQFTVTVGKCKCCATCRYWSELIARAMSGGPTEALCLGSGPFAGQYTASIIECDAWKENTHGVIDDPDCGAEANRLYAEEDRPK